MTIDEIGPADSGSASRLVPVAASARACATRKADPVTAILWIVATALIVIGEYVAQCDLRRAGEVGAATWIGLLLGTAVKIALVFAMVGIFVFALAV